jgi:hypothetical protein
VLQQLLKIIVELEKKIETKIKRDNLYNSRETKHGHHHHQYIFTYLEENHDMKGARNNVMNNKL